MDDKPFGVRSYESSQGLIPIKRLQLEAPHPCHEVMRGSRVDHPPAGHHEKVIAHDTLDTVRDHDEQLGVANLSGIEVDGCPTPTQHSYNLLDTRGYRLRIDTTENYMYADSGIGDVSFASLAAWCRLGNVSALPFNDPSRPHCQDGKSEHSDHSRPQRRCCGGGNPNSCQQQEIGCKASGAFGHRQ